MVLLVEHDVLFCKLLLCYIFHNPRHVVHKILFISGFMESNMVTIIKWIIGAFFAGLVFLIARIVDEYFSPYKKRT
jgi:hypothetical protein